MTGDVLISFKDVSFSYDGKRQALSSVDLDIRKGDFLAIVGDNGSGKTTLAMHMNALLIPDSGKVESFGIDTSATAAGKPGYGDLLYKIRSRIGYVFQNPDDQIVSSLVEDEVAFGPENLGLASDEITRRVRVSLESVGMSGYEKADVNTLSGGQKQRVAIASELAMNPDMLLFDEPTSMLDEQSAESVMELLEKLNGEGKTVVLITHRKREIERSKRVVRLCGGKIVFDGPYEDFDMKAAFPELPTKEFLGSLKIDTFASLSDAKDGSVVSENANIASKSAVKLKDVSFRYNEGDRDNTLPFVLEDIDAEFEYGETVAIMGSNGSGKSTLIRLMNGLLKPTTGRVAVHGRWIDDDQNADFARYDVGICFQYPEKQLFGMTVYDDVSFGPRNLKLTKEETDERVRKSLEMMGLTDPDILERSPFSLSGGQQRKVAIAGVLAMNPKTIVLDEPCSSLDPKNRIELIETIAALRNACRCVIMVTHSKEEAYLLADRIMVLKDRTITTERL